MAIENQAVCISRLFQLFTLSRLQVKQLLIFSFLVNDTILLCWH